MNQEQASRRHHDHVFAKRLDSSRPNAPNLNLESLSSILLLDCSRNFGFCLGAVDTWVPIPGKLVIFSGSAVVFTSRNPNSRRRSDMATATWIRNTLEQEGVAFEELHHPEVYTAQKVAQSEHITGHRVAKVVIALADGRPVELILPASRQVQLDWLRQLVRAREVRLASEEEIEQYFTDCEVGAIPALRHWQNVDVLMDASMQVQGDIVFQAGTHRDAVRMHFEDWFKLVNPRVEQFSVLEGTDDCDWPPSA
jgi:Ala-tRNA(Pro) deacylase